MDENTVVDPEPIIDYAEVRPLHYKADRKRPYTLIGDEGGNVWLMPTPEVPGDFVFALTLTELKKLPKPYSFKKEIKEVLPSVEEVQRALWQRGVYTLDDLRNVVEVRNALGSVLPSANAFVKFSVGEE